MRYCHALSSVVTFLVWVASAVAAHAQDGGLSFTVGRQNVHESLRTIHARRASRNLAPISKDLLQREPFISLDRRLTNDLVRPHSSRVEIFLERCNTLNRVNDSGFNGSLISPALLIRNGARGTF